MRRNDDGAVPQTGGLWLTHYQQVIEAALGGRAVSPRQGAINACRDGRWIQALR